MSARTSGSDQAAQAARSVALAAVPEVLRSAGPSMQEAYLSLLASDVRARQARREATCQAETPAEVAATTVDDWLRDALTEPSESRRSGRVVSPLEIEVLRYERGAEAPERIAALLRGSGVRGRYPCARLIDLLDAIARLGGPQRALAVRLMLQEAAVPVS